MSLPLLECKYVTEEFVREGKNGNYGSKLPSSVPMLRFLYELCWNLVHAHKPLFLFHNLRIALCICVRVAEAAS